MDSRAITAWIAAAMLLAQASVGLFGVSRRTLRESHIVLGLILLPLTFAHAWLSMKSVSMKSDNLAGLWLAAAALLLLGVQVLLGTALIRPSEGSGSFRRVHLAVGLGILSLASVHVLLIRK
jgi:hypothetical protein